MAVSFSEAVIWREPADPQLRVLAALLGEDFEAAQLLALELKTLRDDFSKTGINAAWGVSCFPVMDCMVYARMRAMPQGGWVHSLQAADLSPYIGRGAELRPGSILPERGAFAQWAGDGVFLEALRDAALLCCLQPGGVMRCQIRESRQAMAEALLADLLANALPPQWLRYATFAAGSGQPPSHRDYTLLLSAHFPGDAKDGAFADFTAQPPALDLRFPQLNFAQRTVKSLLAPLGLSVLLSMWNAAARTVIDNLGEKQAAAAQDLITWQMLRRNFSSGKYAITEEEHRALQAKVKEMHQLAMSN